MDTFFDKSNIPDVLSRPKVSARGKDGARGIPFLSLRELISINSPAMITSDVELGCPAGPDIRERTTAIREISRFDYTFPVWCFISHPRILPSGGSR